MQWDTAQFASKSAIDKGLICKGKLNNTKFKWTQVSMFRNYRISFPARDYQTISYFKFYFLHIAPADPLDLSLPPPPSVRFNPSPSRDRHSDLPPSTAQANPETKWGNDLHHPPWPSPQEICRGLPGRPTHQDPLPRFQVTHSLTFPCTHQGEEVRAERLEEGRKEQAYGASLVSLCTAPRRNELQENRALPQV